MKVLKTGTLGSAVSGSGVTGVSFGNGTATPPIDLSAMGSQNRVGVWLSLEGSLGNSGGSLSAIWKGSPSRSGDTYTAFLRGDYLVKDARTTGGFFANGSYLKVLEPCMPWIKLEAIVSRAGTTNAAILRWGVVAF